MGAVAEGTLLSRRYLIGREVGAGGMGIVFEAVDLRTGGQVAVKVLHALYARDPRYVTRLRHEAQIAASIRTPRAVRVIDLDIHEGTPFLVMEFVAGETLAERIERQGSLAPREALRICIDIARALEGGYEVGVVHRDLKPQNVKITDEGEVKVLDFGIARADHLPGVTGPDIVTGTPAYCAPERLEGPGDIRSDIYSLGVVLYEALVGDPPFAGPTTLSVLNKHKHAAIPALPESVPGVVQAILDRALAKRPEDRYQTPTEFLAALRSAHNTLGMDAGHRVGLPPVPAAGQTAESAASASTAVHADTTAAGVQLPAGVLPRRRLAGRLPALAGVALIAIGIAAGVAVLAGRRGVPSADGDQAAGRVQPSAVTAAGTPLATSPGTGSPMPATPAATPAPLLRPSEKVTLNRTDTGTEALLLTDRTCPGLTSQVRTRFTLTVTSIERVESTQRVVVSYRRRMDPLPGIECSVRDDLDWYGDHIVLETELTQAGSGPRTIFRASSVGGTGLSVPGTSTNIYGAEHEGTWIFDGVELHGTTLTLVQKVPNQTEQVLHRLPLLPP